MLHMAPKSFRLRYCSHLAPELPIVERRGPRGGRRILVRRADVEALIESMTVRQARIQAEPGAPILVQKSSQAPRKDAP